MKKKFNNIMLIKKTIRKKRNNRIYFRNIAIGIVTILVASLILCVPGLITYKFFPNLYGANDVNLFMNCILDSFVLVIAFSFILTIYALVEVLADLGEYIEMFAKGRKIGLIHTIYAIGTEIESNCKRKNRKKLK